MVVKNLNQQNQKKMSEIKLKIGDFVYLKTDIDQYKRMVTGYTVRDNSENVVYLLSFGEDETSHYRCEISLEEDILLKATN